MLNHPTHERLIELGLTGMAKAFEEQRRSPDLEALPFEDRIGLLVDREAAERDTRRLTTRLKIAALRQTACVEDVDLRTPRGIDRAVFAKLVEGRWIDRHENLLVTGATGRAIAEGLMKATIVVEGDPARDPCLGLAAVGIALEVDVLMLEQPPQPLDEDIVHPTTAANPWRS
ncbi:hypothetical protein AB7M74_006006 [Bradyrhizobium japonicum]